jgi:hypothetical protein
MAKKKKKAPLLEGEWTLQWSVKSVLGITEGQADYFLLLPENSAFADWSRMRPYGNRLMVTLDYPLGAPVKFRIDAYGNDNYIWWSPGSVLWRIAQKYKEIYKAPVKHGIWGHVMSDLFFERIKIDARGNCTLFIGS